MATPLEDLWSFLLSVADNPAAYAALTFLYAIAVAVVLPIPIELALLPPLLAGRYGYLTVVTIAVAAGKTLGAWLVFRLGVNAEETIRKWSERLPIAERVVEKLVAFVRKTRTAGLYIILSIPLMPDTVTLYIYSLFNKEGEALDQRMYIIANFLAAFNRVAILIILYFIGLNLFGL